MELRKLIIHELVKESVRSSDDSRKKVLPKPKINPGSLLNVEEKNSVTLVTELNKLYGKRDNSAIYGTFSREQLEDGVPSANDYPASVDLYIKNDDYDDALFKAMTLNAMGQLLRESSDQEFATGGYIVFSHYFIESNDYILIAMIKGAEGLNINSKLEIESIKEIDLSKIHQAARINIFDLRAYVKADDENDEVSRAYLSFVSPRSNKSVSGYFIKALDCLDSVTPTKATNITFSCVDDYLKSKKELKQYRSEAKDSVVDYFELCLAEGRPATIAGIDHAVRKVIPATYEELMNGFIDFSNSEKYKLPNEFNVAKPELEKFSKVKVKGERWEIKFDAQILSEEKSNVLYYDKVDKKLTLRCNAKLIDRIEEILNERKKDEK
ncbi:nucleoid-associated protein [Aeromonas dhakensis]|uniref:nucleoid-associated protein n=1 Tax=Aeromonas dhakensis TaxID=196024 RepID=UPI0038D1CF6F